MWKNQGSWNFFHAKLIPNSSNGMLFSIQKFVSVSSQDNTVEFCGWTSKTDLSTDAKKDEALADAQFNAIRKVGEITIP